MLKLDIFDGYRTTGLKQLDRGESLFDEIFSISEDPLCQEVGFLLETRLLKWLYGVR